MGILFYLIAVAILIIPLFWDIKHEKGIKPTIAGIIFMTLVLVSIAIYIIIESNNKKKDLIQEKTLDSLFHNVDSLTLVNVSQYDSLIKMQKMFNSLVDSTLEINNSIKIASQQQQRPIIKLISVSLLSNGSTELRFVNDGKIGATNFNGKYLFVIKSLDNNVDTKAIQKPLPLINSDIITEKDDYVSVNIPSGIFNPSEYLDKNWIYLVISLRYSDINGTNFYLFETTSRLRKSDNGKFSGSYNYEHDKYVKLIKK